MTATMAVKMETAVTVALALVVHVISTRWFRLSINQALLLIFLSNEPFHGGVDFINIEGNWRFYVFWIVHLIDEVIAVTSHELNQVSGLRKPRERCRSHQPARKTTYPCLKI